MEDGVINQVDMSDIRALRVDQPGFATAALAHEIIENHEANKALSNICGGRDNVPKADLEAAHQAGEAIASTVMGELIPPGTRIAQRRTRPDKWGYRQFILDMTNYYIVYDGIDIGRDLRMAPQTRVYQSDRASRTSGGSRGRRSISSSG
jgi:hypothetical protein